MRKNLDTDQITNELKGQSLYFEAQSKRLSKKRAEKDANARTSKRTNGRTSEQANARTDERTNTRTSERANGRTSERTNKRTDQRTGSGKTRVRIIKRHSYQFYTDQIEDIRNLWLGYQAQGLDLDLSDLAREAFDQFLRRTKEKAKVSANGRTDEQSNERTGERTNG